MIVVYFLCAIINTLIYKSLMSLETSDKELATALERLSITNEITTINNENNVTVLTQNVFDAIDLRKNALTLNQYLIISKRQEFLNLIRKV